VFYGTQRLFIKNNGFAVGSGLRYNISLSHMNLSTGDFTWHLINFVQDMLNGYDSGLALLLLHQFDLGSNLGLFSFELSFSFGVLVLLLLGLLNYDFVGNLCFDQLSVLQSSCVSLNLHS